MTALIHARNALDQLHASDAYKLLKPKATFPATHIAKCELELLATIADLQPPAVWAPDAPQGPFREIDGKRSAKAPTDSAAVYFHTWSNPSAEIGREIKGAHVFDFLEEGVGFLWFNNGAAPKVKPSPVGSVYVLRDVISERIGTNSDLNGTTEFCIRFGQAFDADRIVARSPEGSPGWTAAWFGGMATGKIRNFDLEAHGHLGPTGLHKGKVGGYVEHAAHNLFLERGRIASTGTCINEEWAYTEDVYSSFMESAMKAALPGRAGPYRNTYGGATWDDRLELTSEEEHGIYLGPGNYGDTIRNIKFRKCPAGAISLPRNLPAGLPPNVIDLASCDFSECTGPHVVYHDSPIG